MNLDAIKVGARVRHDMGDLTELAESMKRYGLLHPIVVLADNTLVAGKRRIEAARALGWMDIAVTVVDVADLLSAERDENTVRKDFTPTEAVAIGKLIEEQERPKAMERQRLGGLKRQGLVDPTIPLAQPQTREVAARAVGMGLTPYRQAKAVVVAAEAEPKKFGDLPGQMDETGNVAGTHREMERRRTNGKTGRHPVHYKLVDRKPNQTMQKAVLAFDGLCMGLEALDVSKLDPAQTKGWAKSLTKAAAFLRRLSRKVANVKG